MIPFPWRASRILGLQISLSISASLLEANPKGGVVVSGEATISDAYLLQTVTQSTEHAIINWDSFSVSPAETLRFQQPAATSVTLNRVVGVDPSMIFGKVEANGNLFLINPNGIFFGSNSRINVGSLVASTLGISDDDFLEGRYNLVPSPDHDLATIINKGQLKAAEGGSIALVAPLIDNEGTIVAAAGRIILRAGPHAAGRSVRAVNINDARSDHLVTFVNTFSETPASRVQQLNDGTVWLRGVGGIVVNEGILDVRGTGTRPSGRIDIDADNGLYLLEGSRITAKATESAPESGTLDILTRAGTVVPTNIFGTTVLEGDQVRVRVAGDFPSAQFVQIQARQATLEAFQAPGIQLTDSTPRPRPQVIPIFDPPAPPSPGIENGGGVESDNIVAENPLVFVLMGELPGQGLTPVGAGPGSGPPTFLVDIPSPPGGPPARPRTGSTDPLLPARDRVSGGVLGARDNVLLPGLRASTARRSSGELPSVERGRRDSRATRATSVTHRDPDAEGTAGLIRTVRRSRGRRQDLDEVGPRDEDAASGETTARNPEARP